MTPDERKAVAAQILADLLSRYRLNDVRRILKALSCQWQVHIRAYHASKQNEQSGEKPGEKEQNDESN